MSKPILSELEYNASDVASAILNNAELSVTNQDFAVDNKTSIFERATGWNENYLTCFSFNGFMFVNISVYTNSTPSNGDKFVTISDSDYYPDQVYSMPTIGHEGDTAYYIQLLTNGEFNLVMPDNDTSTGSTYYININGWYRF